jgi:uncharacterized protein (UPF0548 family)
MWSLRRPTAEMIERVIRRNASASFSYDAVGRVADLCPAGFNADVYRAQVGGGEADWVSAREVLRTLRQFPAGWTAIYPEPKKLVAGETLAMMAWGYGVWWLNACRIVEVVDEPDRFSMTYGTLTEHVECGEERFLVELLPDGTVWYEIRAFSRPRLWVVRAAYPFARRLQRRFAADSIRTVRAAVENRCC